jgi:hypothetical protein
MGIETRTVAIAGGLPLGELSASGHGASAAVMSAEALAGLRELASPGDLQDLIENTFGKLLVFSVGRARPQAELISWLTRGAVSGVSPAQRRRVFRLPEQGRAFSGAFAGQRFTNEHAAPVGTFAVGRADTSSIEVILLADEQPAFLHMQLGACELFLLCLPELPDINQPVSAGKGVEAHYDQLIPLLVFLRHSFGEACWHGVGSTARLIIDDPLLTERYGFLDYRALASSMRAAGYGTSIAFIPWNSWRTSRRRAEAIFEAQPNLSVCVHGCDHSNKEFDQLDPGRLQWQADTALRRMERHRSRTGVPFEPVMVFPQGRFSSAAMLALRSSGFLAAVNTTCFPTDAAEPLTIADFLRPAILKFHGLPVFQRRYPRRLIDFAFDVFVGKPVLIVQHHDDFRAGYRQLEEFVHGLHKLAALSWDGLSNQLMQSCLVRSPSASAMEVRFFTRRFVFKNDKPNAASITFSKEEPDQHAVTTVLVDGTSVPFAVENGVLSFLHHANAGQVVEVSILDGPRLAAPAAKAPGVTHVVGVPLRRALSEIRDNSLMRHPRLMAAAAKLAESMGVTGKDEREA